MSEQLLVEETIQRASARLESMLGLLCRAIADSKAQAQTIAGEDEHLVDPLAASLFAEAEKLLISASPRLDKGVIALLLAAKREPAAYASTFIALLALLDQALDDTAEAELAAALEAPPQRATEAPETR